jgi:hypothetical protein
MFKLSMEFNLLRKPLLMAIILFGLQTGVMGQTSDAQKSGRSVFRCKHGGTTVNL